MKLHALIIYLGLGLSLALSLAACEAPPESRTALSEPGAAAYDARLSGKWVLAEEDGAHYIHITPREDSALLDILAVGVGYQDGDPVRWLRATAHASSIDGETYYNVKRAAGLDYTADGEQPGYILMRVKFTGDDELALCFLGSSWGSEIDDLMAEGLIAGRKVEGDDGNDKVPYSVIDMTRPELIALIREAEPGRLFPCMEDRFDRTVP